MNGCEGLTKSQRHKSREIPANCLDKIRNTCYAFGLSESLPRSPVSGREDKKPWLFETLACKPPREPERGSDFLSSIARNPLKKLVSQK
jgi:hypothetical protein